MSRDGFLPRLMECDLSWTANTVRCSLHTGTPAPVIDPAERTRLFLIDADGERHECQSAGPGVFAAPALVNAQRWEIWSESTGAVLKGTFEVTGLAE